MPGSQGRMRFNINVIASVNEDVKKEFNSEMMQAHNACRDKHNTPHLQWSDDLAEKAQAWANKMAADDRMIHQPGPSRTGQGENLAGVCGQPMTGTKATTQWYNEIHKYNYDDPKGCKGVGHFTQVVWKNSREMGAGIAMSATGWHFVVARYRPAGNMRGANRLNVLPLAGNAESDD